MKIYLGSDHAGVRLKEKIKADLMRRKIPYEDLGTTTLDPVDYPDYAFRVAEHVAKHKGSRGILICGTGTGMTIAANKVDGIRAVAAYDTYSAKMSRVDNDTNVLGLRGRYFPTERAMRIIAVWLRTPFSGKPRHRNRLRKIADYEKQ
ncbi:MAG: ribose 5-phosphate isomerase B [Acidobacteriota bacterium]|nr:ribose 5-phosphate isomerase B [Acidobacteriota bacterium]